MIYGPTGMQCGAPAALPRSITKAESALSDPQLICPRRGADSLSCKDRTEDLVVAELFDYLSLRVVLIGIFHLAHDPHVLPKEFGYPRHKDLENFVTARESVFVQ